MKKAMLTGLLAIVMGLSSHADAALIDNGCGLWKDGVVNGTCIYPLIYDSDIGVTWIDYTYKGPCACQADGATIDEANKWITDLNNTPGLLGAGGWQLPTLSTICAYPPCSGSVSTESCASACKAQDSFNAIGYLYWISLPAARTANGGNIPFTAINLSHYYWTNQAYLTYPIAFSLGNGGLGVSSRNYVMAMHFGSVQESGRTSINQVQTRLTDFRGQITNEKDAALLEEAIQHFANAQDPALWTLNQNNIYALGPESGKTAFREAELAVRSLNTLIARGYALQRFVDETIYVARWLAQNAVSDAIASNSKPQNIAKAMDEMSKATEDALERYGKAWEAATK